MGASWHTRDATATICVTSLHVRISPNQLQWLESQTRPFHNKSAVIRDLIESAMQGLHGSIDYPRAVSGAEPPQGNLDPLTGYKSSLKQPEAKAQVLELQQQPLKQPAVPSSAHSINHEKKHNVINSPEKARKPRAKNTKGTPEFEAFWKIYLRCRHRANGQSKPKAFTVWQQLVPEHLTADDLTRAIEQAVSDIESRQALGEFASPLPDCFRWMRDECYAVYLEDHEPMKIKPSWKL